MMKKKGNCKYLTTRNQYKVVKKYDHGQFDEFCTRIYTEGFEDGKNSVKGTDLQEVMKAVKTVKGIGAKRMAQIETVVSVLFENERGK